MTRESLRSDDLLSAERVHYLTAMWYNTLTNQALNLGYTLDLMAMLAVNEMIAMLDGLAAEYEREGGMLE